MKTKIENGVMTVYLNGEIDHHTARPAREKIDSEISKAEPKVLVLDFSDVTFMDSSGVGLVMGRYKYSAAKNCRTQVRGLNERDKKIMLLSGLSKLVDFK